MVLTQARRGSVDASKLTAVRLNVNGSVFVTSLEAIEAGAKKGCSSDVLSNLADEARENPGREVRLSRPEEAVAAYVTIVRYLNMPQAKLSNVTDVGALCREARYLGLEELAARASQGNHLAWRAKDVSLLRESSAGSNLQGRKSTTAAAEADKQTADEAPQAPQRVVRQLEGFGGSFKGAPPAYLSNKNPTLSSLGGRRLSQSDLSQAGSAGSNSPKGSLRGSRRLSLEAPSSGPATPAGGASPTVGAGAVKASFRRQSLEGGWSKGASTPHLRS
uniref:Uncharacterized protein n=1 Tax=Hemiselmis tepida TaxID=464990 RepID=A0A6T6XSZ5_9CRYP|mmetsp:Transcript_4098/g.10420  ORF Transcript_4098/g.10420 Transcript_4098/m.10420 type:complete len:276 (+) Transcript_4098:146-973(+)